MLKKRMNKKGFTLVELIVVIAIMAVLAAVLVPTISNQVQRAADSKVVTEVSGILDAVKNEALSANSDTDLEAALLGKFGNYTETAVFKLGTDAAVTGWTAYATASTSTTLVTLVTVAIPFELKTAKGATGLPGADSDWKDGDYVATLTLSTGVVVYTEA